MTNKYEKDDVYFIGWDSSEWLEVVCWPRDTSFFYWSTTVNPEVSDRAQWDLVELARELLDRDVLVVPFIDKGYVLVYLDGTSVESWLRLRLNGPLFARKTFKQKVVTRYAHVANRADWAGVRVSRPGDFLRNIPKQGQLNGH